MESPILQSNSPVLLLSTFSKLSPSQTLLSKCFSKLSVVAFFAVLAAAAPQGAPTFASCNTGPVQCCNSVQDASHHSVVDRVNAIKNVEKSSLFAGLLPGINADDLVDATVGDVTAQVGIDCTPVTVIGVASGSSCSAQPVCCSNNNFNGLVAVGCTPINVNA
ncbi:hypothetical protein HGRIS_012170 [Hohenbuehelia grisea]|uniref:Hydrophobin n=1 Tax=Hohenbuehelia grisea TaxID=104357 RepID=A0ABR3IRF7_9AGAR